MGMAMGTGCSETKGSCGEVISAVGNIHEIMLSFNYPIVVAYNFTMPILSPTCWPLFPYAHGKPGKIEYENDQVGCYLT
eukprot:3469289-Amphidinium_carterae.1